MSTRRLDLLFGLTGSLIATLVALLPTEFGWRLFFWAVAMVGILITLTTHFELKEKSQ